MDHLLNILKEFKNLKKQVSVVSVNEELAEELHKSIIKEFKKISVYERFKDNIWAAYLAEMRSVSSKSWNVTYLLCVIDIFTKYSLVKPLKDEKGKTVPNASIEIVNEFLKLNSELWVVQKREFYNELIR